MKIYLATAGIWGWGGIVYPKYISEITTYDKLKIYLAGEHTVKNGKDLIKQEDKIYILESFIYVKDNKWVPLVAKTAKDLMLDSGAYTFMKNKKSIDFVEYVYQYADFIKQWNIKHFFELDIDQVVGLKEVEKLRDILENKVGRQCIPVWHKSRGLDYWKWMIKNYSYISLSASGNNNSSEWTRTRQGLPAMKQLNDLAREQGVKVHALGYTSLPGIRKIPFYSVDSTAWLYGNRSGMLYLFSNGDFIKIKKKPGTKLKSNKVAQHNFNQWIKFQKYAEQNL